MRTRPLLRIAALAAVSLLPGAGPLAGMAAGQEPTLGGVTLTLLHTNDGESALLPTAVEVGDAQVPLEVGGVAAYASVVGREVARARDLAHSVVNVYAGDAFLASPTLACSLPPAAADTPIHDAVAQALIPWDAHVLGNHEFDYGPDFLRRFVTSFRSGGKRPVQPFLSANLDFRAERAWRKLLAKGGVIDGRPKGGRVVAGAAIVTDPVSKERFGVVGATTPLLPTISSPRKVRVTDDLAATAAAVQRAIDRLSRKGIDRVILVSHLQDIEADRQLVGLLRGVDVAVAGGSDGLLASDAIPDEQELLPGSTADQVAGTYPLLATDADGRPLPMVTTPGGYRYLGRLDVVFDSDGAVTGVLAETSYLRRVIPDSQDPQRLVDLGITDAVPPTYDLQVGVEEPVRRCIDRLATTPLARSEVVLVVARGSDGGSQPGVRWGETNGGDLVADALLAAYDAHAAASGLPPRGADARVVALQNAGGIRQGAGDQLPGDGVPGGPVSRLDTLGVLPFDNQVVVVSEVTTAGLRAILERSCASVGGGGFLQVAALAYTCDLTRSPGEQLRGVRLTAGTPEDADDVELVGADGSLLDAGPLRVVTNRFMAGGGDGYAELAALPATTLVDGTGTAVHDERALRDHLGTFPAGGEPALPTIPADDPRYAEPEGEGRIVILSR